MALGWYQSWVEYIREITFKYFAVIFLPGRPTTEPMEKSQMCKPCSSGTKANSKSISNTFRIQVLECGGLVNSLNIPGNEHQKQHPSHRKVIDDAAGGTSSAVHISSEY